MLLLWECFVAQCPDMVLVSKSLDILGDLHEFYRQPLTAKKYRDEAARLRLRLAGGEK